jgi:hypothetical protein
VLSQWLGPIFLAAGAVPVSPLVAKIAHRAYMGICGWQTSPRWRRLRGVWRDLNDEVGVEGDGDPVEERDGRDDAARL